MKKTTAALIALAALGGCGDTNDQAQDKPATTTVASTPASAPASTSATTPELITRSQADAYARKALVKLKAGIADQMSATGSPAYECVAGATAGTFDCEFTIRYRKLSECGKITAAVTIGRDESGEVHSLPGQKNTDLPQGCFIGEDGEPVPDNPSE